MADAAVSQSATSAAVAENSRRAGSRSGGASFDGTFSTTTGGLSAVRGGGGLANGSGLGGRLGEPSGRRRGGDGGGPKSASIPAISASVIFG